MMFVREACAPAINPMVYHAIALLRSVHNIIIEALWRWLREKTGHNLLEIILRGKIQNLIKPSVNYHR